MRPVDFPLHRRLRAARALAGYDNQVEFAEHIPGMTSRGPINKLENGKQKPTPQQLIAWARTCELPLEFFFADYAALKIEEAPSDPLALFDELDERIRKMQ